MSRKPLQIFAGCVIAIHLTVAMGMDWGHSDFVPTDGRSSEHLSTHTCGAFELHKSLDSRHGCLLCFRNANFVAFATPLPARSNPAAIPLFAAHLSQQSVSEQLASLFQRGPPRSSQL